jgi:hypothetical protein
MELRNKPNGEADAVPLAEGSTDATHGVGPVATALPESKNSARSQMSSAREPGDLGGASPLDMVGGRQLREGGIHKPRPQAPEESDARVVPKKSPKTRVTPVEAMEGRGAAQGKLAPRNARRTQGRESAATDLERVG